MKFLTDSNKRYVFSLFDIANIMLKHKFDDRILKQFGNVPTIRLLNNYLRFYLIFEVKQYLKR